MSGLRTMLPSVRLMQRALRVIAKQQCAITLLQHETKTAELAHMRHVRDLVEQFLIALDKPEHNDDYREALTTSLGVYRDYVAVLEEHVQ